MQLLAERNVNYREQAKKNLNGKVHFDRQRVEITGLLSADDTRRIAPGDFDDYIKPSVKADKDRSIWDWFSSDYNRDMKEMAKAMRGEMTKRAVATVAAYKDLEINEIVAHSWGSELIYAAILNGEMLPPKKLIVLGVPDDDHAKWALLAARTGTEVFWGRADNDAAALDKGVKVAKEAAKDVDFEAKWNAACAADKEKNICLPHDRRPQPVVIIPVGNLPVRPLSPGSYLGHDREDYYDRVRAKGFFKGTAPQLMVADNKRVVRETEKVEQNALESALREARTLVEKARELAAIAKIEHEERLKNTMADMANRSCASPGSVTQADMDALPASRKTEYQAFTTPPIGLDSCSAFVYAAIGLGADEAEILRLSTPTPAPAVVIPTTPRPAPAAVVPMTPPPFANALPELSAFADAACRAPETVSIEDFQGKIVRGHFFYDYSYVAYDNMIAADLSSHFNECAKTLLRRLIDMHRGAQIREIMSIDRQWIRNFTSPYLQAPIYPGGNHQDPTGCIPGNNSRRNCLACGNTQCG